MSDPDDRPADFDPYWHDTLEEMARYPARAETEAVPMRRTDFATMYCVRFTGLGPYRLFGYLGIPEGDGPFPAIYHVAGYGSVVTPVPGGTANLMRSRYMTFSIAARGYRNADRPYAAEFPGLLTDGIEDPRDYMFRGIVADCVRGLEVLLARPEVEPSRVVAVGNDMALITAALGRGVTHVVSTPALFYKTLELAAGTNAYPLEEINDYLRLRPRRREAVRNTLSYFDVRWHAPRVEADTLVLAGAPGSLTDHQALGPLAWALPGEVTIHDSESSTYKDGLFTEQWISSRCGFDAPIVPTHWR